MDQSNRLARPLLAALSVLALAAPGWSDGDRDAMSLRLEPSPAAGADDAMALRLEGRPSELKPAPEDSIERHREAVEAWRGLPEHARTDDLRAEYERTLFHLGALLAQEGRGARDRELHRKAARLVLEELVFEAGETSELSMLAYDLLGDLHAEAGEWEEAAQFYKAVIRERLHGEEAPGALAPAPPADLRRLLDARRRVDSPREERAPVLLDAEDEAWESLAHATPSQRIERLRATDEAWRALPGHAQTEERREQHAEVLLALGTELATRVTSTADSAPLRAEAERALEAVAFEAEELGPRALRALELLGDLAADEGDWQRAAELYGMVSDALTSGA